MKNVAARVAAREHPHERGRVRVRAVVEADRHLSPRRAVAVDDIAAAATADDSVQRCPARFGAAPTIGPISASGPRERSREPSAPPPAPPPASATASSRDRRSDGEHAERAAPCERALASSSETRPRSTAGPPLRAPSASATPYASAEDQLGDRAQRRRVGRDEHRRHDRLAPLRQVVADLRRRADQRELLDQLARDLRAGLVLACRSR